MEFVHTKLHKISFPVAIRQIAGTVIDGSFASVPTHTPTENRMSTHAKTFPPFSLTHLLSTVFQPKGGERVAILIDLENPADITGMGFLKNPALTIQRHAHDVFYRGLRDGGLKELNLTGGDLFAYQITGGSNLDLPDLAVTPEGREISLEKDVYPKYDIILCISTYSATAPLTAFAKKYGFRGATLHGLNDIILGSGLAVDYNAVSVHAEKLRLGLTKADWFELDFPTSPTSPPAKSTTSLRARRASSPCATRTARSR